MLCMRELAHELTRVCHATQSTRHVQCDECAEIAHELTRVRHATRNTRHVQGPGFRFQVLGFGVWGSDFKVLRFRVVGLGFRVQGLGRRN